MKNVYSAVRTYIKQTHLVFKGLKCVKLEKKGNLYFNSNYIIKNMVQTECGPGSSIDIATSYRLDGQGIESRWGARFSAPVQTGPGAHPASCTMGTRSFPGGKSGRGVNLTPHHLLVPWSWKGRAIPLLPLWAVRPVQSLSARKRGILPLPLQSWCHSISKCVWIFKYIFRLNREPINFPCPVQSFSLFFT